MKRIAIPTVIVAAIGSLVCGCNKTEPSTPAGDTANAPAEPPIAAPATPAPAAAAEAVKAAATELTTKFVEQAKAAADSKLGEIASELTAKMRALTAAVGTNAAVKVSLESTLQSLTSGLDANALNSAFKVAEAAKFTTEQLALAKEVGNLASAFVVQKNFAAIEGAQGDVATIVKSLRSGEITAAIPALKNVATNVHLTDSQKQLVTTVADKYAPGWKNAAGAVDAIKKIGF
jgi:hypothetical protein